IFTLGGVNQSTSASATTLLQRPAGLKVNSGNLYVADQQINVVWKIVISTGVESIFAGVPGLATYAGDGGAAVSAKLNGPTDIAFDSTGNAYIADSGNHRVRKVDTSGNISTWVGTGTGSSTGDGGAGTSATINSPQAAIPDTANNLYIAEFSGN